MIDYAEWIEKDFVCAAQYPYRDDEQDSTDGLLDLCKAFKSHYTIDIVDGNHKYAEYFRDEYILSEDALKRYRSVDKHSAGVLFHGLTLFAKPSQFQRERLVGRTLFAYTKVDALHPDGITATLIVTRNRIDLETASHLDALIEYLALHHIAAKYAKGDRWKRN